MHLVAAMSALFEDENSDVCPQAQEFVANRSSRWTEVAVEVGLINGEHTVVRSLKATWSCLRGWLITPAGFIWCQLKSDNRFRDKLYMSAVSNTPYRTGAMQLYVCALGLSLVMWQQKALQSHR